MNYYRFPRSKVTALCFFLYFLAMQCFARSTMISSTLLGFYPAQAVMLGLIGLCGIAFLVVNRKNWKQIFTDRRMIAFGLSAVLVLGDMLVKQDWQMMYFTVLLGFWFAIFLTYFMTLEEAAGYYVRVMLFLSVWAIAGQFLLKPLAQNGILPTTIFRSPGGWAMHNFGLAYVVDLNLQGADTLRTFGVFREPGLFQIFLFIAIQLNNYTVRWKKEWQMWAADAVLFVTLLLTFATGGVLALGLYIVFLFFDKKLYRDKRLRLLAILAVIAGAALLGYALASGGTWAYELVGMVEKILKKTDSYTDRVGSIIMDAKIFLQHPLVGEKMVEVMYSVPNNTATSPILFAIFGIAMGAVHVLSWAALAWRKDRHVVMNLIQMVILFVPFNTQNVVHDLFFWLFPIMALTEKGLPMLKRKAE